MVWLFVLLLLPATLVAIRWARAMAKRSVRAKGRVGGVTLALGLAFGALFDPPKAAAIENVEKQKRLGDIERGAQGELLDEGEDVRS